MSMTSGERTPLSVVFLLRSAGFPEGMAATNRVRLMGRALVKQGVAVEVICTRVTERPGSILNRTVAGQRDGIRFLYAAGATVRSDSFVTRRYREIRGFMATLIELRRLQRRGAVDCVYIAEVSKHCTDTVSPNGRPPLRDLADQLPTLWLLRAVLRRMGIPLIVELNELPAVVSWLPPRLSRQISPLSSASAVTPISDWLRDWARSEAARLGATVEVLEIPIVVDIDEQVPAARPNQEAMLVFSVSAYHDLVASLFRSMRHVWQRHPDCRLTVTGVAPDIASRIATAEGVEAAVADGRLVFVGYLGRPRLLELYSEATALLVPLQDDLESRARFPTKIGEYLAAARPVVTTAVGEIPRFLSDGDTAYVAATEDPDDFAASVIDVLDDPEKAARVGLAGRELAERLFDFELQGPPLANLVRRLSRTRQTTGET